MGPLARLPIGELPWLLHPQHHGLHALGHPLPGPLNVRPQRQMSYMKTCGFQIIVFACWSWIPFTVLVEHFSFSSLGSFFGHEANHKATPLHLVRKRATHPPGSETGERRSELPRVGEPRAALLTLLPLNESLPGGPREISYRQRMWGCIHDRDLPLDPALWVQHQTMHFTCHF